MEICIVLDARHKSGRCLGPEGNGVSLGEGRDGGPSPPGSREDKQSSPSEEGGNIEKEGRRKDQSGVMKKDQRAQSELSFQKEDCNSVIVCNS